MLQAIRFVNCQSFDDVTLKFATDRCNVIIAENNTGKSILFKFLKITANPNSLPAKKRRMLIRHGTDNASMICGFTDGAVGITTVLSNSVIYRYKPADSEEYIVSPEPIEEYTQHLGLIIDKRTRFVANIIDTDQDMLLVNSDQKGNSELITAIAENGTITSVKEKVGILQKDFINYNTNLTMKISAMEQISNALNYEDVNELEIICSNGDFLYNALSNCCDIRDVMQVLHNSNLNQFNYTECIKLIDAIQIVMKILEALNRIQFYKDIQMEFIDLLGLLINIVKNINSIRIVNVPKVSVEAVQSLMEVKECISCIKPVKGDLNIDIMEGLNKLFTIKNKINFIYRRHSDYRAIEVDCARVIEDLLQAGNEIVCPVHGKVVYNGKECVPYNI